jgi:flagellar basal body-associated protein FliL
MQKILVPALAVIFLLAGGTVGVMKWMQLGPFAPEEVAGEEAPAPRRSTAQPRYVDIDPINIAVIQNNRPQSVIQIAAKLEVSGDKDAAAVQQRMIRLTNALITDLHDFLPRLLREVDHIELDLLRDRMQYVADKTLGKGLVKQVLIQSVHDSGGKT